MKTVAEWFTILRTLQMKSGPSAKLTSDILTNFSPVGALRLENAGGNAFYSTVRR